MPTTFKHLVNTTLKDLTDSSLHSLSSSNGLSLSAACTPTDTAGYLLMDLELYLAAAAGLRTANTSFDFWIIQAHDGTNYADGDGSNAPARSPDGAFVVRATSGALRLESRELPVPAREFKVLVRNSATGQATAASGNTLKALFHTPQGV